MRSGAPAAHDVSPWAHPLHSV